MIRKRSPGFAIEAWSKQSCETLTRFGEAGEGRPYSNRLRLRAVGGSAVLRHELVEFRLVFGVTQAVEERHEFALLFFETAQGVGAIFVKGAVAAGRPIIAAAPSLRGPLHPLHAVMHSFHATLPTIRAAVSPA